MSSARTRRARSANAATVPLVKPYKWHGGKDGLASRIVGMMPPRCANPNDPADGDDGWLHYVEERTIHPSCQTEGVHFPRGCPYFLQKFVV
jgi:hypothetical protein